MKTSTPKAIPNIRAWAKLYEQDPVWCQAWNRYVFDNYNDEHRKVVLDDDTRYEAYQRVLRATSVAAKRREIRAYLTQYAPSYLPPKRRRPED